MKRNNEPFNVTIYNMIKNLKSCIPIDFIIFN